MVYLAKESLDNGRDLLSTQKRLKRTSTLVMIKQLAQKSKSCKAMLWVFQEQPDITPYSISPTHERIFQVLIRSQAIPNFETNMQDLFENLIVIGLYITGFPPQVPHCSNSTQISMFNPSQLLICCGWPSSLLRKLHNALYTSSKAMKSYNMLINAFKTKLR